MVIVLAQRLLFVDPLDIWLMLLGTTLLVAAYGVYVNVIRGSSLEAGKVSTIDVTSANKVIGLYFFFIGLYAFITGIWGTITWPLPGGNNIPLIQPWALFGVALMIIGVVLWTGISLSHLAIPLATLGIPVIVYAFTIWLHRLTKTPEISGLMYFLIGVATLSAPLIFRKSAYSRTVGWAVIVILVIAAAIALYIGISAAYGHIESWRPWRPWYGSVPVG